MFSAQKNLIGQFKREQHLLAQQFFSLSGILKQLCCLFCMFFFSASVSADANETAATSLSGTQINLSKQNDHFMYLEVRQAQLGQVLKEIAAKTGVRIHYSALPESPVTATCVGATVGQILDCLVGKQIGLVSQGKPEEFWLLGSSVGSCQAVIVAPMEQRPTKQPGFAQAGDTQAMPEQPLLTKQEQSDALLNQLKNANTSEQRAEALSSLATDGLIGDPNVRKALDDAVIDKDANIRAQAISTLANLDKEGVTEILANALHDNDVSVRMAAVDHADGDAALLRQALADTNASVRDFAAAKLAEINQRQERLEQ
jgi:hypothetical protein